MVEDCEHVAPQPPEGKTDLQQAAVLLKEMAGTVHHVTTLVDNMIQKVQQGDLSTDQGLSFLEMKYNMLLNYLINLTYMVLRKCTGHHIAGDPCIDRLVEIRTILDKLKPIGNKLKYQIDKLVKTAVFGENGEDPTSFKANPESLMEDGSGSSDEGDDDDDGSGKKTGDRSSKDVYVPPKISAVYYSDKSLDKTSVEKEKKKRALSSSILQELKEEYLDTPVEVTLGSRAQNTISKQQQEREQYEEEYLTRLPVGKNEKNQRKQLGTLADEITNFGSGSSKRKKTMKRVKGKNIKRRKHN